MVVAAAPPPNTRAGRMHAVLMRGLSPAQLTIEDESARHAGHSGAQPGGETHYKIFAVSEEFTCLNRVERSRYVHLVLKNEFKDGLHALSLTLRSPSEV